MSKLLSEGGSALVGVAVYVVLRLIDKILPEGHHFRFVHRFLVEDDPPPAAGDDTGSSPANRP